MVIKMYKYNFLFLFFFQYFTFNSKGEIKNEDTCLNLKEGDLILSECEENDASQKWSFEVKFSFLIQFHCFSNCIYSTNQIRRVKFKFLPKGCFTLSGYAQLNFATVNNKYKMESSKSYNVMNKYNIGNIIK